MTLAQYQEEAKRTSASLKPIGRSDAYHMKMGIFTECGELLDAIKKYYAYQKPIDIVNIGEEIGDIMWYVVNDMTFDSLKLGIDINSIRIRKFKTYEKLIDEIVKIPNLRIYKKLDTIFNVCVFFNLDLYELLDRNIAKLKARYPEKFTTENALNRDLEKEREILGKGI